MGSSDRSEQQTGPTLNVNGRLAALSMRVRGRHRRRLGVHRPHRHRCPARGVPGLAVPSLRGHPGRPSHAVRHRHLPRFPGPLSDHRLPERNRDVPDPPRHHDPVARGSPPEGAGSGLRLRHDRWRDGARGDTAPAGRRPRALCHRNRSKTPIGLAAIGDSGIIGKLLGDVGISRIGIYYASDAIAEFPLFDAGKPEKQGFAGGISFSARFGAGDSFTDIALPPPRQRSHRSHRR